MKRVARITVLALSLLLGTTAHADENAEHLIRSCRELVDIYAKRDQQRLLAGVSTSLSEALRAGYCMGVVEEYRRVHTCSAEDWYQQAESITRMADGVGGQLSVDQLLEGACEI